MAPTPGGHTLLTETAMRAQLMAGELTQIVIPPPRADNGLAMTEDREIPLTPRLSPRG